MFCFVSVTYLKSHFNFFLVACIKFCPIKSIDIILILFLFPLQTLNPFLIPFDMIIFILLVGVICFYLCLIALLMLA